MSAAYNISFRADTLVQIETFIPIFLTLAEVTAFDESTYVRPDSYIFRLLPFVLSTISEDHHNDFPSKLNLTLF